MMVSLILFISVAPMALAWYLVKSADRYQLKHSNHGEIISTAPNISKVAYYDLKRRDTQPGEQLLGKWWLVYVAPEKCYQECQEDLYNMRQVQAALGRDALRVDRLFVAHPNCPRATCENYLSEFYPDMQRATFEHSDFNALFIQSSKYAPNTLGRMYIIDPLGNIMMAYAPDTNPKEMLSDLKRLLRVSKIG